MSSPYYPAGDPFAAEPYYPGAVEDGDAPYPAGEPFPTEGYPDGDPFSGEPEPVPPHDPETGELLEPEPGTYPPGAVVAGDPRHLERQELRSAEPVAVQVITSVGEATPAELIPVRLADTALDAVTTARAAVTAFTADLGAALEARIGARYSELQAGRPDGPVTNEVVAPELRWLADADEVLGALGGVFTRQAKAVRELAGEAVQEVHSSKRIEAKGGQVSVKVGAGGGAAVKVTASQATEAYAEAQAIVDVLVPYLLAVSRAAEATDPVRAFTTGARHMAALLLGLEGEPGLLTSPGWKTTALDQLREALQGSEDPTGLALAGRLRAAYGRRPKGDVRTTIERVAAKEVRDL